MTDTIDGAALLNEVEAFHRRFNVFPTEGAYVAVTLWDAHAHLLDSFDSTPRLASSPLPPGIGQVAGAGASGNARTALHGGRGRLRRRAVPVRVWC